VYCEHFPYSRLPIPEVNVGPLPISFCYFLTSKPWNYQGIFDIPIIQGWMFAESVTTTWFDYCSDLIICKFALHGPKLSLAVCHWQSQFRPNWKPLFHTSYVILCIKVSDNCTLGAKINNFCFSVFSMVQFIWGEKTACFCGVFLDNSKNVLYLKRVLPNQNVLYVIPKFTYNGVYFIRSFHCKSEEHPCN